MHAKVWNTVALAPARAALDYPNFIYKSSYKEPNTLFSKHAKFKPIIANLLAPLSIQKKN
jgi:hypothetical protein